MLRDYVGRPTPLSSALRFSALVGARVWLKREDLNHTGAYKINNTVGQAILAAPHGEATDHRRDRRRAARRGHGHGLRAVRVGMRGLHGRRRHAPPGAERLPDAADGATVVPVTSGTRTLKDATTEAIRDWVASVRDSHYIIGSVVGPAPYPRMVREFQAIIGREAREQMLATAGALPRTVVACVGGGSNAAGIFAGFIDDAAVELVGVEAAGEGVGDGASRRLVVARGGPGCCTGR